MHLSRKGWLGVAAGLVAVAAIGCGVWLALGPTRVDMARYAPDSAMLFVEVDSLPDLAGGLTSSDAWRGLAGPLGLSSQLDYAGPAGALFGQLELGPDEAVALGRAQFAVVVTGLEAGAEAGDEPALVLRPRFALVVKTHTSASRAKALAEARLPMLARRAYGEQTPIAEGEYSGASLSVARGPEPGRQMVWAVLDDVVVIGNDEESVRGVVDAALERAPSLAGTFYLPRLRQAVDADGAAVFAYVSRSGAGRVFGVGPGLVAGAIAADVDRGATVSRLVGSVSEGAVQGLAYSGRFEDGRFVDRYYAMLAPHLADAARARVRPAPPGDDALDLAPAGAAEVTAVRVAEPGATVDALMTSFSSQVDVGVAALLTQLVIETRRGYGVEADEPVSPALGDHVLVVDFGDGSPLAVAFEARDSARLLGVVERYLKKDGSRVSSETYRGVDILRSTHEDGRAAAFAGRQLVFGTRDQIARMVDARATGGAGAALGPLIERHPEALLATERRDAAPTAELLLAISAALRASDGSPELLERPDVRDVLDGLPPATSRTELRDGGLYVESRSAVGNLTYLTIFL
jgi:hypothetical protein